MTKYRYVVNTFNGSEPVQRSGSVHAVDEWDAVNQLIKDGIVDPRGYEFLELKSDNEPRKLDMSKVEFSGRVVSTLNALQDVEPF